MSVHRYSIIDQYTLEELVRKYKASSPEARIQLIEELYDTKVGVPYEVALLAVGDASVEVRQWFARKARALDYRETERQDSERDLTRRVKRDRDPFVRAALRENPNIYDSFSFITHWKEFFQEANHLERLALVRNPAVSNDLIQRIFDPEDKELNLSFEEKKELALAYLSNPTAQEKSRRKFFSTEFIDGFDAYHTTQHYRTLYKFISKWPKDSFPLSYLFHAIQTDDVTKAEFYQGCSVPFWRASMLANCSSNDTQTLQLGMQDPDADCRRIAFSKIRYLTREEMETLVNLQDQDALWGLAGNENLSIDTLRRVRDKLRELDHDLGVSDADVTIKKLESKKAIQNLEELFSRVDEQNNLLREKIDLIGSKIISLEQRLREIWIAVIIALVFFAVLQWLK